MRWPSRPPATCSTTAFEKPRSNSPSANGQRPAVRADGTHERERGGETIELGVADAGDPLGPRVERLEEVVARAAAERRVRHADVDDGRPRARLHALDEEIELPHAASHGHRRRDSAQHRVSLLLDSGGDVSPRRAPPPRALFPARVRAPRLRRDPRRRRRHLPRHRADRGSARAGTRGAALRRDDRRGGRQRCGHRPRALRARARRRPLGVPPPLRRRPAARRDVAPSARSAPDAHRDGRAGAPASRRRAS